MESVFKKGLHFILALGDAIWTFLQRIIAALFRWLKGIIHALKGLWLSLGPKSVRVILLVVFVLGGGYLSLQYFLKPNITHENIYQVRYLNDSWSEEQRNRFYYTPQGTELLGLEYDWFVNLELPLSRERLASEENMRGWGFVLPPAQRPTDRNPGNLPVGFTRHFSRDGRAKLDLGCAMCHTGELHYKGTALRVDGGQAMQSVPTVGRGEFIVTLGAASFETYYNPRKWGRFATRVVGHNQAARDALRERFSQYLDRIIEFGKGPGSIHLYPVTEGRGRTDAVGRIANVVFGYDLDVPENYQLADAPASYPYVWDMWRLDWVQYTGFTNQAMARNVGESLGVLAPVKLVDEKGNLLPVEDMQDDVVDIDGMYCVEGMLRTLRPPKWPEDVLGAINITRAIRGKDLFAEQCQACHGPHRSASYDWPVSTAKGDNPEHQFSTNYQWDMAGAISEVNGRKVRRDWRKEIWAVPWIATTTIGTDPKLAENYMARQYDASKITGSNELVNAGDGLQLLLNQLIPSMYTKRNISGDAIANYDGLNIPFRIANHQAYKSKPLHGVWATPPFLHNGSVPSIYDLLSAWRERPKTFFVGNREYDPVKLGYVTVPTAGSFKLDTRIPGNRNSGHLFTDVDMPGRIGRLFSEQEKYDIIEYLKVMGNPDFSEKLGGDPQNWAQYQQGAAEPHMLKACKASDEKQLISRKYHQARQLRRPESQTGM